MTDSASKARQIFFDAIDLDGPGRDSYIAEQCGGDESLRREVLSLLAHDGRASTGFLAGPPTEDLARIAGIDAENPGDVIDRYTLTQLIGQGGFGSVWLAKQTHPVQRDVALKVIKLGMDTRHIVARFQAERQTLASMEHPNIARVLDAGATSRGRPYFVMELVRGEPITRFCDSRRLHLRRRLEAFLQVCAAVQHAHQKGIIHRDLKPSNVLTLEVDGAPVVKVIDFGIARALEQDDSAHSLIITERGQMIGTPEYMSPEQAAGAVVDTRTDIYSLGVLLYELLTGALPFDPRKLRSGGPAEIQRLIRDSDPLKPSARLSGMERASRSAAAEVREGDVHALARALKGDLDWITMRAMEKDPARRYAAASELAADLRRHLAHEPVLAGPPGAAYRTRKFIRRHRFGVAAGAFVTIALVGGVVGTGLALARALRAENAASNLAAEEAAQRKLADRARTKAEAINTFFSVKLLEQANPQVNPRARELTMSEALDAAADNAGDLLTEPDVAAAVRTSIGAAYRDLGRFDDAALQLTTAIDILRPLGDEEATDFANSLAMLAGVKLDVGAHAEALPLYEEAIDILRRRGEDINLIKALVSLSRFHWATGDYAASERATREAVELCEKLGPAALPQLEGALHNLALALQGQERFTEAEELFRRALSMRAEGSKDRAMALNNLASVLAAQDRRAEAEALYREALEIFRRIYGDRHPDVATTLNNIAVEMQMRNDHAGAIPLFREVLDTRRELLGSDHPRLAQSMNTLGHSLLMTGDLDGAEALYNEQLRIAYAAYEGDHSDQAIAYNNLGRLRDKRGDFSGAAEAFGQGLEICRRLFPEQHSFVSTLAGARARALAEGGRADESLALLTGHIDLLRAVDPAPAAPLASALMAVAEIHLKADAGPAAETALRECMALRDQALPEDHWLRFFTRVRLGRALVMQQRFEEAEPLLTQSCDQVLASPYVAPERRVESIDAVAEMYDAWGKPHKAAEWRARLPK